MKKKIFGFCLVFLFLSAAVGFSQLKITDGSRFRCYEMTVRGRNITEAVNYVIVNQYNDGSFQLVLYYRDGTPTEYFRLDAPTRSANGTTYNARLTNDAGIRVGNLTCFITAGETLLSFYFYQNGENFADIHLR